jgi:pyrroline-5-carboxylate reductase
MNKIGFIGYGHMGSVMLKSMLSMKAINPNQLIISTRTKNKLNDLKAIYPHVEIAKNNCDVAQKSSTLFLCVGTSHVKSVLMEIIDVLHNKKHLITISGGLEIASIEKVFRGKVTKVIPTIISEVQEGVTLICHNSQVKETEKSRLFRMFSKIGHVKEIPEHQFEMGADFTSCAPGLLASISDQFIHAGVKQSDFTYEEACEMFLYTLYGTAKLLLKNQEDFKSLVQRVATKGGATEGGVSVLEAYLTDLFDKVFAATLQRHEARKQITQQHFEETMVSNQGR